MTSNVQDIIDSYRLPARYNYTDFLIEDNELQFCCDSLKGATEIKEWVKEFGNENCVEWRLNRTNPSVKGLRCFYKIQYRCQHSKQKSQKLSSNKKSKSTDCPASILVNIARSSKYDFNVQTKVVIRNEHNHETGMTEVSLKYRDVNSQTNDRLKKLFVSGFSPTSAQFTLKLDALVNHAEDFHRISADRSKIPDVKYCYNTFTKFKKEFGNDITNTEDIKSKLTTWCQETNGSAAFNTHENISIFTVITPLMKRVHTNLSESETLVYIQSNDNCVDKNIETIYMIYTQTKIGALPLGYIIISSRLITVFEKALKQFCELDENNIAFFGRGAILGPKNIVIDNSLEINVLKQIWPHCNVLLSANYVLSSVWQWMSSKKHNIREPDRRTLFFDFKNVITSTSTEDILCSYNKLLNVKTMKGYPEFYQYFNSTWWPSKESWCLYYRKDLIQIEQEASKCNQYAFRILSDIFLNYFKVYNTFQLIDLAITRLDDYYSKRITNILLDKVDFVKFLPDNEEISSERIVSIDDNTFLIKNCDKDNFIGDVELNVCTCDIGISGALCEHQSAVLLNKNIKKYEDLKDGSHRILLHIAKDETVIDDTETISNKNIEGFCCTENVDVCVNKKDERSIIHEQLQNVFEDILKKVQSNTTNEMNDACIEFCKSYKNSCQDITSLQSALFTFGKSEDFLKKTSNKEVKKIIKRKVVTGDGSPNKLIKIRSKEEQIIIIVE